VAVGDRGSSRDRPRSSGGHRVVRGRAPAIPDPHRPPPVPPPARDGQRIRHPGPSARKRLPRVERGKASPVDVQRQDVLQTSNLCKHGFDAVGGSAPAPPPRGSTTVPPSPSTRTASDVTAPQRSVLPRDRMRGEGPGPAERTRGQSWTGSASPSSTTRRRPPSPPTRSHPAQRGHHDRPPEPPLMAPPRAELPPGWRWTNRDAARARESAGKPAPRPQPQKASQNQPADSRELRVRSATDVRGPQRGPTARRQARRPLGYVVTTGICLYSVYEPNPLLGPLAAPTDDTRPVVSGDLGVKAQRTEVLHALRRSVRIVNFDRDAPRAESPLGI
jgi:hypothetical protein